MLISFRKTLLSITLIAFSIFLAQAQEDKGAPFKKNGDHFIQQEKFDEALGAYQQMLTAYEGAQDPEGIAEAHKYIGLAYRQQAVYDSSRYFYEKSIDLHTKIYGKRSSLVVSLQRELGLMFQEQGLDQEALAMFKQSLATSISINRKALATCNYIHVGELFIQQKQLDSALTYFDKALVLRQQVRGNNDYRLAALYNLKGYVKFLKKDYPSALKLYEQAIKVNNTDKLEKLQSLANKAEILNIDNHQAALQAYQASDQYIESIRTKVYTQAQRVRLGKLADKVNQGAIEASLALKDYKTAFYFYERDESNAIVALYPKAQILTAESIREQLEPETAMLEYLIGKKGVYVFALTNETFKVTKLAKKGVVGQIKGMRKAIKQKNMGQYKKLAYQLYQRLLKPLEPVFKEKKHLIIVPDKELTLLPFETLLRQPATSAASSQWAYLLKSFNVTYHFSGSLAFAEKILRTYQRPWTAIAPVDFAQKKFETLAASAEEVKTIGAMYPRRKVFVKGAAQRKQLLGKTVSSEILHIATHAQFSKAHPEGSRLLLSKTGITYPEIFKMKLEVDMVVLSHCEPGLEHYDKDGGIFGLGHGFVYAGAHNVVYPLWKNLGIYTRDFMIRFYKEIKKGGRYSKALQTTKLAMLNSGKATTPFDWAGFMIISVD
ncbi:CHAT domain-containing protein [Microscilla marina]|uniref:Tetratricopeptide repeat domain protein n=1 Tax=Microscilla marina ATCC 23134 TaxID=313606 RepID=A1ZCX1_MICM2|nr:CHAT domain-containing tetratricopeptide repeat protein [Microscilla marina]EAY31510.1 tetratricopeptide repeat domain protein [Microscilla marina ATCC 23134]